jgi:hypothetical protein
MATEMRVSRYVLGGAALLGLFLLGWFVFRKEPEHQPVADVPIKPHVQLDPLLYRPAGALSHQTPPSPTNDNSTTTNAAVFYQQAFELFDALPKEQKDLLGNWRTNVDASIETELCEKIQPICDLMQQASIVTNCDWGFDSTAFETMQQYLTSTRSIARTAMWHAAHCHSNDVAKTTDDALSVLRLGQRVSGTSILGCLVDLSLQNMTWSYLTQNVGSFTGAAGQRLTAAFTDPTYEEAPGRAIEQEAVIAESQTANQGVTPNVAALYKQITDSEQELSKALTSGSEVEYETWLQHWTQLQESNPLAKGLGAAIEQFVEKVRGAVVDRALVVAGLAIAQGGTDILPSYPDPASGKPFVYTETSDGFELQSSYQLRGQPLKMQFK